MKAAWVSIGQSGAVTVSIEAPAEVAPVGGVDLVLDIRLERIERNEGGAAAFKFLEKEFRRDPRPHTRARYGEFLLGGKALGAPEGRAAEGLDLVRGALREGSLQAMRVMGCELLSGERVANDSVRGLGFLLQAALPGDIDAMISLGDAYYRGVGIPANLDESETWLRRAALLGKARPLYALGQFYEKRPDRFSRACQLYYEAARCGIYDAQKRLNEVVASNHPGALRAHKLLLLWLASQHVDVERTLLRQSVRYLEEKYPDDPEVLLALARYHIAASNAKRALPLLEQAIGRGSSDARAERAWLHADGRGMPKNAAFAVTELRALEGEGNPTALAVLGYYHYWASLEEAGLAKDPAKAFHYSKRAADQGSAIAQANVALCYEFGIGTPIDLAQAAYYYRAAAMKGDRRGNDKYRELLPFVK